MGYTTEFRGRFNLNKKLDGETHALLVGLSTTRRMKRNIEGFGVEGEFFYKDDGDFGQTRTPDIIDYNAPPATQPGLWLQWRPTEDKKGLEWDEGEKFYYYVEWLEYLIEKILAPKGYVLNGAVRYRGESFDDNGEIRIIDNIVI